MKNIRRKLESYNAKKRQRRKGTRVECFIPHEEREETQENQKYKAEKKCEKVNEAMQKHEDGNTGN